MRGRTSGEDTTCRHDQMRGGRLGRVHGDSVRDMRLKKPGAVERLRELDAQIEGLQLSS